MSTLGSCSGLWSQGRGRAARDRRASSWSTPELTLQEQQFQLHSAVPGVESGTGGQGKPPAVSQHLEPLPCHRQFLFPSKGAWGMALLLLRDQLSLSVTSTLYLATGKVLVNKASVPSRGCSTGWVCSRRDAQSRAFLHQATGESTTHLQHPSLETNQTLSFAAACFSVNPIPASLAPFLRHLVQSPPAAVMNSAGEQCLASSVSLCS